MLDGLAAWHSYPAGRSGFCCGNGSRTGSGRDRGERAAWQLRWEGQSAPHNRSCVLRRAAELAVRGAGGRDARTARPPIAGLDQVPLITAENWIDLREPPKHGYIALEMSQTLRRLGCAVTVLQKADQLAEREDPDVAEILRAALERDGCEVRLNIDLRSVEPTANWLRAHLADSSLKAPICFLLLATNQIPTSFVSRRWV
jgi:hypothetical protein